MSMEAKHWVQVMLSVLIITGGTFIACSKEQAAETRGSALGAIGLVVGYWFKSPLQE